MIAGKGINHATINRIKDYSIERFAAYCDLVRKEFKNREYTIRTNTIEKLNNNINYENLDYELKLNEEKSKDGIEYYEVNGILLFKDFHNERYIRQCFYSFQEKFDCNMISEEEWSKIENKFKYIVY